LRNACAAIGARRVSPVTAIAAGACHNPDRRVCAGCRRDAPDPQRRRGGADAVRTRATPRTAVCAHHRPHAGRPRRQTACPR